MHALYTFFTRFFSNLLASQKYCFLWCCPGEDDDVLAFTESWRYYFMQLFLLWKNSVVIKRQLNYKDLRFSAYVSVILQTTLRLFYIKYKIIKITLVCILNGLRFQLVSHIWKGHFHSCNIVHQTTNGRKIRSYLLVKESCFNAMWLLGNRAFVSQGFLLDFLSMKLNTELICYWYHS